MIRSLFVLVSLYRLKWTYLKESVRSMSFTALTNRTVAFQEIGESTVKLIMEIARSLAWIKFTSWSVGLYPTSTN